MVLAHETGGLADFAVADLAANFGYGPAGSVGFGDVAAAERRDAELTSMLDQESPTISSDLVGAAPSDAVDGRH